MLTALTDIWFHRYEHGRDIEGKFDYNSWIESDKGRKLAASLDKDVILAEGIFFPRNPSLDTELNIFSRL